MNEELERQHKFRMMLSEQKSKEELNEFKDLDINLKINDMVWFDYTNRYIEIKYVIDNFNVNINLRNKKGNTVMFLITKNNALLRYINSKFYIDYFNKNNDGLDVMDFQLTKRTKRFYDMKLRLYGRVPRLLSSIINGQYSTTRILLKNNVTNLDYINLDDLNNNNIKNLYSFFKDELVVKIPYENISNINTILLNSLINNMCLNKSLELLRVKYFIDTNKNLLNMKIEDMLKKLPYDKLKFNGINLLNHMNDGRYLIHNICYLNNFELFNYAVENNCDLNVINDKGFTCLHISALYADDLFYHIHKRNNDLINVCDKKGRTPLYYTFIHDDVKIVKKYLDNNAKINIRDENMDTPSTFFLENGAKRSFAYLIDNSDDDIFTF